MRSQRDDLVPTARIETQATPARRQFIQRIWPSTVVVLGLGLSAAWTCLLAYEFFRLIEVVV
jgi:hypothetical protein